MFVRQNKIVGKLKSPPRIQTAVGGSTKSKRLAITDKKDGITYLIDTGADMSVIPKRLVRGALQPTDFQLFTANNTVIKTYGNRTRVLDLGLRRPFRWQFIVADVVQPIVGADFLAHHGILPDLKNRRLIDELTSLKVTARLAVGKHTKIATINEDCRIKELLSKYIEITRPTALKKTTHNVKHYIATKGQPTAERPRRLTPAKYAAAKREFETMLAQGICQPSSSQWASPLHLVQKSSGEWRPCGDFRRLNSTTVADKYPLPHIQDITHQLHGCTFSKIDLIKAYYQIPVAEEDRHKTAVTTPFGLYEFNRMPFGLRNAAQTFQRFLDTVLRGLDFCRSYIDDLLVASKDEEEHRKHLELVF